MEEVIISPSCHDEIWGNRETVAHIMATIRIIISLSDEEQKSHNPVHMKTKSLSLVLIALLAYFLASPSSQAVSPPPDGGYGDSIGGGNTAIGTGALLKNTTGDCNTALGVSACDLQRAKTNSHRGSTIWPITTATTKTIAA
jgi:hypothetical protein